MQNIIRTVSILLLVLLSACSTTSTSFTTPYSTADTYDGDADYNRQKAASTRLSLGLRYLNQGDYEKAKFNLDKAMEHYPKSEHVLRGLAWYYEKVNEIKLAEKFYTRALKINNKNPELLNQYGVFLCRNNRLDESLKMFETSAKILTNSDVSGTFENAATCNLIAGEKERAQVYYRKALSYNPEQKDSLLGMATIEFEKGRYKRSSSYIQRYEKIARHNARSLWLALRTESRLRNMDAVGSYALKLEQLFPDSEETANYLDTKSQWLN